jgi:hypothetical protein
MKKLTKKMTEKEMKGKKIRAKGRKFNKFAGKTAKSIKSGPRMGGKMFNAGGVLSAKG